MAAYNLKRVRDGDEKVGGEYEKEKSLSMSIVEVEIMNLHFQECQWSREQPLVHEMIKDCERIVCENAVLSVHIKRHNIRLNEMILNPASEIECTLSSLCDALNT